MKGIKARFFKGDVIRSGRNNGLYKVESIEYDAYGRRICVAFPISKELVCGVRFFDDDQSYRPEGK